MITIKNTQRTLTIDTNALRQAAQRMLEAIDYTDFDLGIWLTTDATIRRYNCTYRNKDKPTDILSFAYHPRLKPGERIVAYSDEDKNIGDLIISPAYVQRTAHQWNRTFEEQMTALLAHGIAHLLGYDHETDEEFAVMQRMEKKLLKAVNQP